MLRPRTRVTALVLCWLSPVGFHTFPLCGKSIKTTWPSTNGKGDDVCQFPGAENPLITSSCKNLLFALLGSAQNNQDALMRSLKNNALSLVLLLLFPLAAACGGGGSSGGGSVRHGDFTLTSESAELRADMRELIYVPVLVNSVPATFILDTGADAFVVSRDFAARAGLPQNGTAQISTIAGAMETPLRVIEDFKVGNVVGSGIEAAEVELQGFDGIIGVPLFEQAVVSVDYEAGIIKLSDPATFNVDAEAASINGTVLSAPGFVLDQVSINGQGVGPVRIDTGSGGGMRLSPAVGQPLLAAAPQTLPVLSDAPNGQVSGTAFIADQTAFGPFRLEDQFIVVQSNELSPGLMGSQILQQFYLIFDWRSGKVVFRQVRSVRYALAS